MESTLKIGRRGKHLDAGSWDKHVFEVISFEFLLPEMFMHGRGTISSMSQSAPPRLPNKER